MSEDSGGALEFEIMNLYLNRNDFKLCSTCFTGHIQADAQMMVIMSACVCPWYLI